MKRNRFGRWSVLGVMAVAAALAGWMAPTLSPTTAPAAANPPGQLLEFELVNESGVSATLNVVSGLATAGSTCHILVDGAPAAIITLLPGPNPIMVPQGMVEYTAVGGEFLEERVDSGYGWDDDPGTW